MRQARISTSRLGQQLTAMVLSEGEQVRVGGLTLDPAEFSWEPPITGLVYGPLLNDRASIEQLGDKLLEPPYKALPKAPILYIKPYNTHVGHRASIALPPRGRRVEVGGTLGLVISEAASHVSESRAFEVVGGYTVVIDLSVPQESLYRPPIREKCFDGACPIGPWVVEKEDLKDLGEVLISVYINGELKHQRNLANLVRPIPRLIADVTEFMTLLPGDVLLVGVPLGIPTAGAGDQISVEVSGVGKLECRLEAALAPAGVRKTS